MDTISFSNPLDVTGTFDFTCDRIPNPFGPGEEIIIWFPVIRPELRARRWQHKTRTKRLPRYPRTIRKYYRIKRGFITDFSFSENPLTKKTTATITIKTED